MTSRRPKGASAFAIDRYFPNNAGGTTSLSELFVGLHDKQNEQVSGATESWGSQLKLQTSRSTHCSSEEARSGSPDGLNSSSSSNGSHVAVDGSVTADTPSNGKKSNPRFSRKTRSILRTWFNDHLQNPYPTASEREHLEEKSGLTRNQISLWLANSRRRHRAQTQKEASFKTASMALTTPPSAAELMPPPPVPMTYASASLDLDNLMHQFEEMNPFERWRADMSLDHEPAAFPDIVSAVSQTPQVPELPPTNAFFAGSYTDASTQDTSLDDFWATQSLASYETGLTSTAGASDIFDACPMPVSDTTPQSTGSITPPLPKVARRRCPSRHPAERSAGTAGTGKFWCTFCPSKRFATKHDWQRHEASQHVSIQSWACCITGGTIITPSGTKICTFCSKPDADAEHLETHSYSACQEKEVAKRMFYRKDQFQQHLMAVHECKYTDQMQAWRSEITDVRSGCGFCGVKMETWKERCDHVAAHFRNGSTMDDWVGERGLQSFTA